MGQYGTRIGQYWMRLHDYEFAHMRGSSKTREYFAKKKVTVELFDDEDEKMEEILIPLTHILKIKKEKKSGMYYKDWESFDLRKVLWMVLIKRGINIFLNPYVLAINNEEPKESRKYYLTSPLLDKRIQLYCDTGGIDKKPKPVLIEGYEIFEWFDKNCLHYE